MSVEALEVLVVDDHESMRSILSTLLRAFGFLSIRVAENGEQALRALAERPADIVITDLKMPQLDGVEFTRRLRAEATRAAFTPVVLVTGHASAQRVVAARDAGVNEFVVKPLTGRLLALRLRRIIAEDRPFVRTDSYSGPCRRRRSPRGYAGQLRRESDSLLVATPRLAADPSPRKRGG